MPFTPAHAIAVLPFVKSARLCATALVAGSMAPDFEYFIRMDVKGVWGHDVAGIFLFDLPITFVIVILFHIVVKENLLTNLPAFLQRRFGHLRKLTTKQDIFARPITFAVSACIGAATHVLWDSFTHRYGYFVKMRPGFFDGNVVPFDGVRYPLWYALQYISTIVGLIILTVYVVMRRPSPDEVVNPRAAYWVWLISIASVIAFVRLQFPHQAGLPMIVISLISGICLALIILGLIPTRRQKFLVNPN